MFEKPLSIKELLPEINKKYFLPAIQREFVWKEEQIINLFDSMLKGYPIGSFLFWSIHEEDITKYDFYKFCANQTKNHMNDALLTSEEKEKLHEMISILDGQQRITSLLVGLQGNYEDKELYISLSKIYDIEERDEYDLKYKLQFKTELEISTDKEHWFKVKNIMNMDIKGITNYAVQNNLTDLGIDILGELYDLISSNTINYYKERSNDVQRVLTIFVRVNSGGTSLSYADLLLSMATSNWGKLSAREEINDLVIDINNIGNGFKITKDFILKTSLYLLKRETKFKVSNYENGGMKEIQENWGKIKKAFINTFEFLSKNFFYYKNLNSNYAASVIAYFFYNYPELIEKEKENMIKFLRLSLLKGIYSSSLDTILKTIRDSLDKNKSFKLNDMNKDLPENKQLKFSKKEISGFVTTKYTQKNFPLLLTMLYEVEPIFIEAVLEYGKFEQDDDRYRMIINHKIVNNNGEDIYFDQNLNNNSKDIILKHRQDMMEEKLFKLVK